MQTEAKTETAQPGSLHPVCSADVADFTGYHFYKCGRPAKWDVGNYGARCGLHARGKYFERIRKPLPPNAGGQRP